MKIWFFVISIAILLPSMTYALEFSEIMYNPSGTDSKREWLEVFNDEDNSIDLTTYELFENNVAHGITHYSGPIELSPGSYAIIASNADEFVSEFNISASVYDSVFTLNNTGENIQLLNDQQNTVSSLSYSVDLGANGDGNSLNKISGSWQPREPSPGKEVSAIKLEDESGTTSATNGRIKIMESVTSKDIPKDILISVPEFGIAEHPIEFKVEGPKNFRYEWQFNIGDKVRQKSVKRSYSLPGNYSVSLVIEDEGQELYSEIFPIKVESLSLGLATGYYLDKRYLRISNNNSSSLELGNWHIYVGKDKYDLPQELTLRPQDDYGFYLDHELSYPIIVINDKGVNVSQVTGTKQEEVVRKSSDVAKPDKTNVNKDQTGGTPRLSLENVPPTRSNEEVVISSTEAEQEELRIIFESYDELLTEEVQLPTTVPVDNAVSSSPSQLLASPITADTQPKINWLMNFILLMSLVIGGGLLFVANKKEYSVAEKSAEDSLGDEEIKDYEIISEEDF